MVSCTLLSSCHLEEHLSKGLNGNEKKNVFKMASPMTVGRKPQFPPLAVESRPVFSPQGLSKALLDMFS